MSKHLIKAFRKGEDAHIDELLLQLQQHHRGAELHWDVDTRKLWVVGDVTPAQMERLSKFVEAFKPHTELRMPAVAEIEATIKGLAMANRVAISDGKRAEQIAVEVQRLRDRITADTAEIAALEYRRDHWYEIVEENDQRITDLRTQLAVAQNKDKLQKLLELTQQIEKLMKE